MTSIFGYKKKGNVLAETITIIIVLFFLGILGITAMKAYGDFNDDIQADPNMNTIAKNEAQGHADRFPAMFDGIFIFLFGMFWLFAVLASFLIDTHPAFFIIALVFLFFIIIVGAILSNTFDEYVSDADFLATSDQFPMTKFIFENIVLFIVAIAGSISIVLFAKSRL